MKVTLEFDDRLKPVLGKYLSPAINKMRPPYSKKMQKEIEKLGRNEFMAVYSMLIQLDIELMLSSPEVTIKPFAVPEK